MSAIYVCRNCGSEHIRTMENMGLGGRTIDCYHLAPVSEREGEAEDSGFSYDYGHDEAYWEGSETVGFECADCMVNRRDLDKLIAIQTPSGPAQALDPKDPPARDDTGIVRDIRALLWPEDDPDAEWNVGTIEDVAQVLIRYGLRPEKEAS